MFFSDTYFNILKLPTRQLKNNIFHIVRLLTRLVYIVLFSLISNVIIEHAIGFRIFFQAAVYWLALTLRITTSIITDYFLEIFSFRQILIEQMFND